MTFDLLPLPAPMEAGLAVPFAGEPQTLTLALAIETFARAGEEPMEGDVFAGSLRAIMTSAERASAAPFGDETWTITF